MKFNRKQLSELIREFLNTTDTYDIDLGDAPPPSSQDPSRGGGGGSNRLHQLIYLSSDHGKRYDPQSYIAVPINVDPSKGATPFLEILKAFKKLSPETQAALYQITPPQLSKKEAPLGMQIRGGYISLINDFSDKIPQGAEYEYFTVFHPSYASPEAERERKLRLYQSVTGYTPNSELLEEFELVMHAASALY